MREGLGESHGTSVQASTAFCVGLDRTSCHWPLGQFGNFLKDAKQIRRRNRPSHVAGRFFSAGSVRRRQVSGRGSFWRWARNTWPWRPQQLNKAKRGRVKTLPLSAVLNSLE